jgi:hypothetical protein
MASSKSQKYFEVEMWCHMALVMAPKWSPYKLLWKFGIWYAQRKQRGL